ncbi:MAG: gamma-glutamylcyclotransferase [Planctomycetota bacterium]
MNLPPINQKMGDQTDAGGICAVFVYGTLKRGELRGGRWPRAALRIQPAWVVGELYDLGPYPALLPHQNTEAPAQQVLAQRVLGELWELAPADMPETLRVLDDIEGYRNKADDLYERHLIDVHCGTGTNPDEQELKRAFTYFYARRSELQAGQRIVPDDQGWCSWSAIRLC